MDFECPHSVDLKTNACSGIFCALISWHIGNLGFRFKNSPVFSHLHRIRTHVNGLQSSNVFVSPVVLIGLKWFLRYHYTYRFLFCNVYCRYYIPTAWFRFTAGKWRNLTFIVSSSLRCKLHCILKTTTNTALCTGILNLKLSVCS